MKEKEVIKGLTIRYSNEDEYKLNKIMSFLEKYDTLFETYIEENRQEAIDISNFYIFLRDEIISKIIEKQKNILDDKNSYYATFLTYILLKNADTETIKAAQAINATIEKAICMLAFKYLDFNADRITSFLLSLNQEKEEKMIEDIRQNERIGLYNYALKTIIEQLKKSIIHYLKILI